MEGDLSTDPGQEASDLYRERERGGEERARLTCLYSISYLLSPIQFSIAFSQNSRLACYPTVALPSLLIALVSCLRVKAEEGAVLRKTEEDWRIIGSRWRTPPGCLCLEI